MQQAVHVRLYTADSCFMYKQEDELFPDAVDYCASLGGHLAAPYTPEAFAAIQGLAGATVRREGRLAREECREWMQGNNFWVSLQQDDDQPTPGDGWHWTLPDQTTVICKLQIKLLYSLPIPKAHFHDLASFVP